MAHNAPPLGWHTAQQLFSRAILLVVRCEPPSGWLAGNGHYNPSSNYTSMLVESKRGSLQSAMRCPWTSPPLVVTCWSRATQCAGAITSAMCVKPTDEQGVDLRQRLGHLLGRSDRPLGSILHVQPGRTRGKTYLKHTQQPSL